MVAVCRGAGSVSGAHPERIGRPRRQADDLEGGDVGAAHVELGERGAVGGFLEQVVVLVGCIVLPVELDLGRGERLGGEVGGRRERAAGWWRGRRRGGRRGARRIAGGGEAGVIGRPDPEAVGLPAARPEMRTPVVPAGRLSTSTKSAPAANCSIWKLSSLFELSVQASWISLAETVWAVRPPGAAGGAGAGPPWFVIRATAACRRERYWPWSLPSGASSPAAASRVNCTISSPGRSAAVAGLLAGPQEQGA